MAAQAALERHEPAEKAAVKASPAAQSMSVENQGSGKQMAAIKGESHMPQAFGNLSLTQDSHSHPEAKDQKAAGIGVEPCTPPGEDPMKDPSNPKSPNYDAKTYGPHEARPISPGSQIKEAPFLPYGGMCQEDLVS